MSKRQMCVVLSSCCGDIRPNNRRRTSNIISLYSTWQDGDSNCVFLGYKCRTLLLLAVYDRHTNIIYLARNRDGTVTPENGVH
jgi:hypothetical protein